jgi:hypothetical protein
MSYFAVQTFARSGRGALMEDAPLICKTKDQAVRTAQRLAKKKAGAIAFYRAANDFDDYGAPEFLAVHGTVPEYLADMIPADLAPVVPSEDAVTDRPVDTVDLKLLGWTELL